MFKRIINKIIGYWNRRSSDSFIRYLQSQGISIESDCVFRDVFSTRIDITRPSLVTIGHDVDMNRNFELLTHDWGSHVFIRKYHSFIPSHKKVVIGNNVYFGSNCTVLAGAKIGDNCIIGAFSLVNKEIPSNTVAAGVPAKVICTIDEYYEKRRLLYIQEVIDFALSIRTRFNREPIIEDFFDDYPVFVDGSNFEDYNYPYMQIFNEEQFNYWKRNHKAPFNGFKEFLNEVNKYS
ncbi:DapH/DapD/GlmU-related protein [Emticicia sp. 21SJ11W-3]|uniref:acyltransferase n=1 Tax=Emticicia sp. 21SJ11W-3 TaxID=2916755 RepID=UPI00273A6983|nr:acyltransferase [Emticicia sp. 21SJ11W-3]